MAQMGPHMRQSLSRKSQKRVCRVIAGHHPEDPGYDKMHFCSLRTGSGLLELGRSRDLKMKKPPPPGRH